MGRHGELTSGQAAAAAGISRKAMRIYEERGLVTPCGRTAAGYRLFGADEIDTLRFIRRARLLGLGLDDIGDIVAQHRRGGPVCPNVKRRLADRVVEIDRTIRDLEVLRQNLVQSLSRCAPAAALDDPSWCPIVDGVAAGE